MRDDFVQCREQLRDRFRRQPVADDQGANLVGDGGRPLFEGTSFGREGDKHLPAVLFAALAGHQALVLHSLEQGSDRVGLEVQAPGEVVHRLTILLPEHQQHQILRVGDAELRQEGRVGLRDQTRGGIEPEAELVLQFELFVHKITGGI